MSQILNLPIHKPGTFALHMLDRSGVAVGTGSFFEFLVGVCVSPHTSSF